LDNRRDHAGERAKDGRESRKDRDHDLFAMFWIVASFELEDAEEPIQ
jgi:hypothetical protein